MFKLVLVDDELNILNALQRSLRAEDCLIESFEDPLKALAFIQENKVDLIISDYRMPEMDGIAFLTNAKQAQPDSIRIILSGNSDKNFLEDAINKAEIYRFISKPWDSHDLKITVQQALQLRSLQLENQQLADQVRIQQDQIKLQQQELESLEKCDPGITEVIRDQDGAIVLEGNL